MEEFEVNYAISIWDHMWHTPCILLVMYNDADTMMVLKATKSLTGSYIVLVKSS